MKNSSTFEYQESYSRIPPYIQHIWLFVVATLAHYSLNESVLSVHSDGITSGAVSFFVFPLAVFVGAYIALATTRYRKAVDAVDLMTSTVESIGLAIGGLESKDHKKNCHSTFVHLLRTVYVSVKKVKISGVNSDHGPALAVFSIALKDCGLSGALHNGNGSLNRFLLARAQMKSVVSVPMSRTLKWACMSMYPVTAIMFALYLTVTGMSSALQALVFGAFCYGVWLMIVVAEDLGLPYGQGRAKIALRKRFQVYEERLEQYST